MRLRRKNRLATEKARKVAFPKHITPQELTKGADHGHDRKFWSRVKSRFEDSNFTHSLLDRLITSFLINVMVATVWLTFAWIFWKIFLRF